jgi:hemolysin D
MSYASSNSPSVLLKKDQDQYRIYLQPQEDSPQFNKKNHDDNSEDIYYGTEELLDALPKVWTRGVLYVLVGFAFLALPWATLSKVDETGNARGRIEPQGATQKLDSPAVGSVKAVKVKPGDTVKTGQVLLKLDSEILQTELEQAQAQLSALLNQESQLDMLKNQVQLSLSIQKQQNQFQALEKMSQVNQAKQNLGTKESTYKLQKLERQALLHQVQQQIQAAENDYQAAQIRLDIDSRQVNRFLQLVDDGAVSINQVDQLRKEEQESKRLYAQAESNIKQAQLRLAEETSRYQAVMNQLESEIEQSQHQLAAEENSYQSLLKSGKLGILKYQEQLKDIERQIANLKAEIKQTRSIITSLNIQMQQRVVRSPVDGVVFELPVTKPGEVVQVGQRIAHIAPKDTELVIKANIPVQESGLLQLGMPVKLKFDAFPFQEFGIVEGKVAWISPDSQVSETPQGNIETYQLEITFDQKYVHKGGTAIPLTPGQTANAEVIVRQRRVIDFVLDPFKKLHKNGLDL